MSAFNEILNQCTDTPSNLLELLSRLSVCIPGIQRHYVQGGKESRAREVAKTFIADIKAHCLDGTPLALNYIYGYRRTDGVDAFVPVDGQQRLTTLWLLMLYFGNKMDDDNRAKLLAVLSRFTYDERIHAKRFCAAIADADNQWEVDAKTSPTTAIAHSHWFNAYWRKDTTVDNMLRMLDTIHTVAGYVDSECMLAFLCQNITFKLCLDSFGDDIYMKMNARGRTLTQWENYKGRIAALLPDDLKQQWNKEIEKLSNAFFEKMAETLPDDAFLCLLLRLSGYPDLKYASPLPYIPFLDCEKIWKETPEKLAKGVRQFLTMANWLMNTDITGCNAPYWGFMRDPLQAVFFPQNAQEHTYGLMLARYFECYPNADEDSFRLASRLMWNLLENVSEEEKQLECLQKFLTKDGTPKLYGNYKPMSKDNIQVLEECAKAKIYNELKAEIGPQLYMVEETLQGRCRLALLDLNNGNAIQVSVLRLQWLDALCCEWQMADAGERWNILARLLPAMPVRLVDAFRLSVDDNALLHFFTNRNDAALQRTMIDGQTEELAQSDWWAKDKPLARDWRVVVSQWILQHPESEWRNWLNGKTIGAHRDGFYYLYRTATIRGATPISDWRSDLFAPECQSVLNAIFPDGFMKDTVEMNDVDTRSFSWRGLQIYFRTDGILLRKYNPENRAVIKEEHLPYDASTEELLSRLQAKLASPEWQALMDSGK